MSVSASTPVNIRICLVGEVAKDKSCCEAARTFGVPVITSETGLELIADNDWRTYFVLEDFETPIYTALLETKQSILGPPAIIQIAALRGGLKEYPRPVYNYAMNSIVACFTGVRSKEELKKLVNFIHAMGGGIRKDIMNVGLTHLISTHSGGDKYEYAKTFGLTVVRPAWVYAAWEQRDQLEFRADTEEFSNKYKLKCFEGQKICFVGFPADEHKLMLEMLETNGGVHVELGDSECSHIVVGQHATPMKPESKSNRTHILKSDWFWYTIKNGYAIEKNYLFDDSLYSVAQCESLAYKETVIKKSSMRFIYFMEFYTTESNYVGILDTIINVFKIPLEESVEDNDALLNEFKIKAIFDNFLPIHEVHQSLFAHLGVIRAKWSEDCLIGDIILQHRGDLIKAYRPYVNFFDQMKETLIQSERKHPRFQEFLKINEAKPVCNRQRLQDLMVCPVQRLPRIQLLLNSILKHTNQNNPDYSRLEDALKAIKEVIMDINKYKCETESPKVGRVFSFRKTRSNLKRAVSIVRTSLFGSPQLPARRSVSCE
ncbi:protein ECT2-like [Glossina fuscipes fuscipes]